MNPEKFYWDTCGINVECASFFPRFEKSEIFGLSIPPFPCKLLSAAFCCLKHGTHSSAVEHQIVVLRVVGSNPTEYPKNAPCGFQFGNSCVLRRRSCRFSSVVEHPICNRTVVSSNLTTGLSWRGVGADGTCPCTVYEVNHKWVNPFFCGKGISQYCVSNAPCAFLG